MHRHFRHVPKRDSSLCYFRGKLNIETRVCNEWRDCQDKKFIGSKHYCLQKFFIHSDRGEKDGHKDSEKGRD